ncbi:Putative ATPase subunit of terminase (gpP-like) [Prevotella dentalis DSM 3688]|uniref:ATPase subunit of terminase (GpP-like) n=1 Tax=Prevotella dentalis (strain ATCC 49559 / DSM 3688 / JCM 13448 / NCTC 12043 / ES 2772) TaxID=908937 RepID=F9D793_PREDD|nr:terminase [Prevotella dentalis]AGB29745.1 Putative ATPase subunit of terminase (gpP-like) [Prevotella dentalis DSM 3688]AGB29824.1 Putative ATPase subunit of terminase (gpP-like) [Prevotella dentalis DSM 3688]EGQ11459.1 hypothetical protein HMPREF9136_2721 [Prevotella dentalis DSM 3688]
MATKKELETKKELARILFMQGEQQKDIAVHTGVSAPTITKWVNAESWREQRAAQSITRPELINKLLLSIDNLVEDINRSGDPKAIANLGDKLSKLSSTVQKLDKKASVVDVVEIFMDFSRWLQSRGEFDTSATADFIRKVNTYQDIYLNERVSQK